MAKTPLSSYQKRLLVFLSVATFFEGYDFFALAQILPNLREDLGLPVESGGYIVGTINIGTILAFWIVRRADVWGRARVLTVTIAGYTVSTCLSGFAPDVYSFVGLQLVARIFLLGEWAVSMLIAAEEFPADRRGFALGIVQACSSLGSIFCAGVVPLLLKTPYGWRSVYFVAVIPLVILAFARRNLKETDRFTRMKAADTPTESLWAIWKTPHRKRILQLAAIWFVAYIPAQNAIAFWKDFAVNERGLSDSDVGKAITIAAVAAMPLLFGVGWLIDKIGRRKSAALIFGLGALGIVGCYTLHGQGLLTAALVVGIFTASAYLPVLNAYSSELFPTHQRGAAFAWSNNLIGRLGYVAGPYVVGVLASQTGALGPVVASTAVFNFVAIALVFAFLPETTGRELEDTSMMH